MTSHYGKGPAHCSISMASRFPRLTNRGILKRCHIMRNGTVGCLISKASRCPQDLPYEATQSMKKCVERWSVGTIFNIHTHNARVLISGIGFAAVD